MSKSKEPKPVSKFTKGQKGYFRILKEYAGKFQQWLDLIKRKDTRIGKRNALYSLVTLVFEGNFQRVLGWLERTRPSMFGPLKRALNNILSGVKIIYKTKDVRFSFKPPNWPKFGSEPLWFSELHDKNMPYFFSEDTDFQELEERVLLLANLLEDTADDLQETKQPPEASGKAGGTKKNKKKLKLLTEKATTEYSFPLPMTKWAIIFGVSENKLRELRKENKYHFDQISKRKWRLPKQEIPTEYLEKYRQERIKAQ